MNKRANDILLNLIPRDEIKRVLTSDAACEIAPGFLCFAETYYHLSQIIPLDYTVIDFGCAYNAQSYFFTNHKQYIAVEPSNPDVNGWHFEHFCAPNCQYYNMTTGEFLKTVDYPKTKVFAICNNVPNWYEENSIELIKKNFNNVFTFYVE